MIPQGRRMSASFAALAIYAGVRVSALALTLLMTLPLIPIDALARA